MPGDQVDGEWFAINRFDRQVVLDVGDGRTDRDAPVYCWEWNGGDNQQWKMIDA